MIIDIVCTFSATTIQAETKSVSLVLTFPATQLSSNICEEVKDCLGIVSLVRVCESYEGIRRARLVGSGQIFRLPTEYPNLN